MDDDELEATLRAAEALADPVPPHLLAVALGAYVFRTVDAELAELTFDSVSNATLVRGGSGRVLTFTAESLTMEVELSDGLLVGRLLPGQPAEIEIRSASRTTTVTADDVGRFTATPPGLGPFSLRCLDIVTEWVS
jgi:hypothetical protein